jgi:hypothetical protein
MQLSEVDGHQMRLHDRLMAPSAAPTGQNGVPGHSLMLDYFTQN